MSIEIVAQATLHPDVTGTADNLIDDNPATTSTFPTDNDADYHVYGDLTSTTAIGLLIDPVTTGQLTFHMTIYPPWPAPNWGLRISPIGVTAGKRYLHVFTLADRYASSGTITGPRYPVTEDELQQRLRDAFLDGWPGYGPYLSTNYEVTAALYQYGGSSPSATVEVAELKICEWVTIATGPAPPLRQYPRTDGLAGSARRLWPPARSTQHSLRHGAGTYL